MVSFRTAASTLALLASASFSGADNIRASRRLSYELIAGYEPLSQVTDHVSEIFSSPCCDFGRIVEQPLPCHLGQFGYVKN